MVYCDICIENGTVALSACAIKPRKKSKPVCHIPVAMSRGVTLYYLFIASLFSYFVGEYIAFPMKPAALQKQTLTDIFIRLATLAIANIVVLWFAFGYWGLLMAAALVVFHGAVDLVTRPFFNMIAGRRVLLTLIDLVLHIVTMFITAVLISLFANPITHTTAILLQVGAVAATGILFYPTLAKTLLVDGFPRFYAERPFFELTEWLTDAAYGFVTGLACYFLTWRLALILVALLTVGYYFLSSYLQKGRPVLVLSKIGVLLLLVPCFFFVFKV